MSSITYALIGKPIQDAFVQSSAGYAHSSAPTKKTRGVMRGVATAELARLAMRALAAANARTRPGKPLDANTHLTLKSIDVQAAAVALGRPIYNRDLRGGCKFTCEEEEKEAAAAESKKKDEDEEMKD